MFTLRLFIQNDNLHATSTCISRWILNFYQEIKITHNEKAIKLVCLSALFTKPSAGSWNDPQRSFQPLAPFTAYGSFRIVSGKIMERPGTVRPAALWIALLMTTVMVPKVNLNSQLTWWDQCRIWGVGGPKGSQFYAFFCVDTPSYGESWIHLWRCKSSPVSDVGISQTCAYLQVRIQVLLTLGFEAPKLSPI